jgi:hypothetical protein
MPVTCKPYKVIKPHISTNNTFMHSTNNFIVLILLFFFVFTKTSSGQEIQPSKDPLEIIATHEEPALTARDAAHLVGQEVYIRDTIAGVKLIRPSLKLLYLGAPSPHQTFTILFKGKEVVKKLSTWKRGIGHFSGAVLMYHGKPAMIITNIYQTGTRVMM